MVIHILHSPRATKGCHNFLHGETILLAPLCPHSPFSVLREGVTTPNLKKVMHQKLSCFIPRERYLTNQIHLRKSKVLVLLSNLLDIISKYTFIRLLYWMNGRNAHIQEFRQTSCPYGTCSQHLLPGSIK